MAYPDDKYDNGSVTADAALIAPGVKRVPEPIQRPIKSFAKFISEIQDTAASVNAALASKVNIRDWANTSGTAAIADGDSVLSVLKKVHTQTAPPGTIVAYAGTGSTAPAGWFWCDGGSHSRTTSAALFAAIGTTYGYANSETFYVPNLEGRVIVAQDTGQTEFNVLGETGGAKTHTLTTAQIPSHAHDYTLHNNDGSGSTLSIDFVRAGHLDQSYTTETAGGGGSHNNLQPYMVLRYIIKY